MSLTVSQIGTTTIGSLDTVIGGRDYIYKKITLSAGDMIQSVSAAITAIGDGVCVAVIYDDNGGVPGTMIGFSNYSSGNIDQYDFSPKRFVSFPLNYYSSAGEDVWLSLYSGNVQSFNIANESTGGTDREKSAGNTQMRDASFAPATDATTNIYSIYANVISGLTVSQIGTSSVGASDFSIGQYDYIYKKITLAAGQMITGISARVSSGGAVGNASGANPVIFSDNSGSPDEIIAISALLGDFQSYLDLSNDGYRWLTYPMSYRSAAGEDVWIAMFGGSDTEPFQIAYETTGGTDETLTGSNQYIEDAASAVTQTYDFSLYANVI